MLEGRRFGTHRGQASTAEILPPVRQGLHMLLFTIEGIEIAGEASDGDKAVREAARVFSFAEKGGEQATLLREVERAAGQIRAGRW